MGGVGEMARERDLEGKGRCNSGADSNRVGSNAPGEDAEEAAAAAGEGVALGVASECSEGYNNGCNSDCCSGGREAEVVAAAL